MKKRIFASLLLCSLALTTIVIPGTAFAESIDEKIQQKDSEISNLKTQQSDVQTQIASLESTITDILDEGQELREQQTTLETKSAELKQEIEDLNVRIEKRSEAIKNQARDVQVNGQSTTIMDAVLSAESFSDAIGRVYAAATIVNANNDLVTQQKADKDAVVTKQAENEEKLQEIEDTKAELEVKKQDLVSKQADLTVLKTSLELDQESAEGSKAALLQQKADAEAEQARIAAEQKAASEKAAQEKAAQEAAASSSSSETAASSETANTTTSTDTTQDTEQSTATDTGAGSSTGSSSNNNNSGTGSTGGSSGGNTVTPPTSSDPTLNALNALRTSLGLSAVSWDAGLAATATARAAVVEGNGWQIPSDHWSRGDEVIAIMWAPGNSVIMAWYNETGMTTATGSGHRDWEINPTITRVGFGYSGSTIVGHSA
ncbi:CAP domain-containing protein [uncultured Enterococcus sp.]|uniref:PcsB-like coiled-coil domain-containing protein n=1 Tax=uncultured Enterococcus sp. TaxID=167972 RepID=UPI002AA9234C|nr:CAP domain-containing protein [uncultured Enterococcus sp.]